MGHAPLASEMPLRFVLLEHRTTADLHWDLMVEQAGQDTLVTWRLLADPLRNDCVRAESIGRHRKVYLDYEGEISGGRGSVRRVDRGTVEWRNVSDDNATLALSGERLRGEFEFMRDAADLLFRRTSSPSE